MALITDSPSPALEDDRLAELQPLVVRTARLVVGAGSAIAEDAAQEALLELSRALPRLREPAAARTFAARIAVRVALRVAKRERRLAFVGLRLPEPDNSGRDDLTVEILDLKAAFDRLPPRQRATAVLRLYLGFTEAETAAVLNCSIGTVKHQLHDARRALAAATEGEGST